MPVKHPQAPGFHLADLWKLVFSGLGAIGTFVGVIQLSYPLKGLIGLSILVLWGVFEIIIRFKKGSVDTLFKSEDEKQASQQTLVPTARWMFGGILLAISLAAIFKGLEARLTPPKPPISKSIYSVIVLDATERMNLPFEGSINKWSAAASAFQDYFERANGLSNYGLIVIGGQNPQEKVSEACGVPSVPLIPLVNDDGHGNIRLSKDLTLGNLSQRIEKQQPEGNGSLSRAFFLAKNQLENLPMDLNAIRIIVLVASASDGCEGDIDWDNLISDIQLVSKEIAIHKELILLDEKLPPRLQEIVAQNSPKGQPTGDPDFYIHAAKNYDELMKIIDDLMDRLTSDQAATPSTEIGVGGNTEVPRYPTLHVAETASKAKTKSKATATDGLITVNQTSTCTPTFSTPDVTALPASTEDEQVPASTMSVTPTFTLSPTITFTPTLLIYPTDVPTKKIIKTVAPPGTNTPKPPPTTDPCCKHCSEISQPCGGTCIPLADTCHVGPGCACKP